LSAPGQRTMRGYILRRVLMMIPVILIITFAVATMMQLVPGDPATLALGQQATDADRQTFREAYHLNDSVPVQYLRWWQDVLFHGNLGESVVQRSSVTSELRDRLPSTVEMLVFAVILSAVIGVPFGVLSALRRNTALDYILRLFSIGGLSIPGF